MKSIQSLQKEIPEAAIIGLERRQQMSTVLTGSLATLLLLPAIPRWALLLPFAGVAVWLGASQVAPDRQRGHLAWLYALPMPAGKVLDYKYGAGTLLIAPLCVMAVITALSSDSILVLGMSLAIFAVYSAAFLISCVSPSRLVVIAVLTGFASTAWLHPMFLLLALGAVPLAIFMPECLLTTSRVWWPRFDRAVVRTNPWGRFFLPAAAVFFIPTALAWFHWNCYLTTTVPVMKPLAHLREIKGVDIAVTASRIWVRKDNGFVEERMADDPERFVSARAISDEKWDILVKTAFSGAVSETWAEMLGRDDVREDLKLVTGAARGDRLSVRRAEGLGNFRFQAFSTPTSLSGVPNPALAIQEEGHFNSWQSAFLPWTRTSWVVMPFPEELETASEPVYRAIAVDAQLGKIYLIGEGGLTIASIPGTHEFPSWPYAVIEYESIRGSGLPIITPSTWTIESRETDLLNFTSSSR